jgi:competence transcription factor ComK
MFVLCFVIEQVIQTIKTFYICIATIKFSNGQLKHIHVCIHVYCRQSSGMIYLVCLFYFLSRMIILRPNHTAQSRVKA